MTRKIYIDGDSCPVKKEIVAVAAEYDLPVVLVISVSHGQRLPGASILQVDNRPEAVDVAIANRVSAGDMVVTRDYGLAALILAKGAYCISPGGMIFSRDNIDQLLFERHLSARERRAGFRTKGSRAFTRQDRDKFRRSLRQLIETDY